jgi:hypothetical protein
MKFRISKVYQVPRTIAATAPAASTLSVRSRNLSRGISDNTTEPVKNFVSRSDLEDQIKRQLHDSITVREDTARILVVYGLGGAGKSQLVLGYVRAFRQDYSPVFVIDASGKASIELNYIQIYRKLHGIHSTLVSENIEVDVAIEAVKSWLTSRNERCLFVFDAADELDDERAPNHFDVHRYLPCSSPHLDVVITTRSRTAADSSNLEPVEVGDLSLGVATELFLRCSKTGNPSANITKEVATIVEELGCLALAVTLAGAYVAATDHIGIGDFLPKYRDRRIEFLKRKATRNAHNYQESVLKTWEMTYTAISKQCPAAAEMLSFLAFLSNNDILLQILSSSSSVKDTASDPGWQRIVSPDIPLEEVVDEVFETLAKYSLVKWSKQIGSYSMHKLVHAWGHDRLTVKARAKYGAAALECLATTSLHRDPNPTLRAQLAPHIMASFSTIPGWFDAMEDAKEITLERVVVLADCLKGAGLYESEKGLRTFEHEKRENLSPAGDPKLLRATNELAIVFQQLGKYGEAVELHRRALAGWEKVLGKEHPSTLASVNNLATVLRAQGDHKAAGELYRRALAGCEKVPGKEHPSTLTSVWCLAALVEDVGQRSEAVPLYERAVIGFGAALGSEHPITVQCERSSRKLQQRLKEVRGLDNSQVAQFTIAITNEVLWQPLT